MSDGHSDAMRWSRWSEEQKLIDQAKKEAKKFFIVLEDGSVSDLNNVELVFDNEYDPEKDIGIPEGKSRKLLELVEILLKRQLL